MLFGLRNGVHELVGCSCRTWESGCGSASWPAGVMFRKPSTWNNILLQVNGCISNPAMKKYCEFDGRADIGFLEHHHIKKLNGWIVPSCTLHQKLKKVLRNAG